jgi:hypothetical protein
MQPMCECFLIAEWGESMKSFRTHMLAGDWRKGCISPLYSLGKRVGLISPVRVSSDCVKSFAVCLAESVPGILRIGEFDDITSRTSVKLDRIS